MLTQINTTCIFVSLLQVPIHPVQESQGQSIARFINTYQAATVWDTEEFVI